LIRAAARSNHATGRSRGTAGGGQSAAANMQVKSVTHVNETYTESGACPFDIRVHLDGSFKAVDYYDNVSMDLVT
jgi:hypothetical protein